MRAPALLVLVLGSLACGPGDLATRVTENASETARVAREAADLRRRVAALEQAGGSPATASGAAARDRSITAEALADGLATYVAATRALPAADPTALVGVWRADDEVLHLADGGRLCGWRLAGGERRPFWGTWRVRGPLLLELRDRWVGDHNESEAMVRDVGAQRADGFTASPGNKAFSRSPTGDWERLASLGDDRAARLPGVPDWCLRRP